MSATVQYHVASFAVHARDLETGAEILVGSRGSWATAMRFAEERQREFPAYVFVVSGPVA